MLFPSALRRGRLVRRYKRFLADVQLEDGTLVVAHCANPGSMRSCAIEGSPVWLSFSSNAKRKLPWTWEVVEVGGTRVYVNPARANDLVAEAIAEDRIAQLRGYDVVEREVAVGSSRIDFRLRANAVPGAGQSAPVGTPPCYVEVKCATMASDGGGAAFPDAVTRRGTRHLEELLRLRAAGARAVLLFCVSRHGATSVRPADEIDPVYAQTLRLVVRQGVEVFGYRCDVVSDGVSLRHPVPVLL